ncbi:MAG: restriction endonuclease subunit M [Ignavibacterium sp.]|nr:MAG: restriction endonuclease subunit M [Ignavibacterium sp.]
MKRLYFGDCLDVLKRLHHENPEGLIDLIYIDPPFNSQRNYNVIFEDIDMTDTKAQKEAFKDTWSNVVYLQQLEEISGLNLDLYNFLKTIDSSNLSKHAVSYLTTMAIRIYYMHKVLKTTGSFYLHCDPTMSHYLKIVCDLIFGESNFINEITWERSFQHNLATRRFDVVTDILLVYAKSEKYKFYPQYMPISKEELEEKFPYTEPESGRRFNHQKLEKTANANSKGEYRIIQGRRIKTNLGWVWDQETFDERIKKNPYIIYWTKSGRPRYKLYADEYKGRLVTNLWTDIKGLTSNDSESLSYPTQKPEALLERIIRTSTDEGDLVADFFCGCGTTIAVAEKLNRNWLGVDISHLAIKLIVDRLTKNQNIHRPEILKKQIEIKGFPRDLSSAKELANNTSDGRYNFQAWVIEIMLGGILNPKRTADGGWDGYITFNQVDGSKGVAVIEVKSGKIGIKNIREFIHVVLNNENRFQLGVFVCFKEYVSKNLLKEAAKAGFFDQEVYGTRIPKIQIITVEDLLEGKSIILPSLYIKTTMGVPKRIAIKKKSAAKNQHSQKKQS